MKLSETTFAKKLATAPQVSIAARVAAAERALAERRPGFDLRIMALVEELAALAQRRPNEAESRVLSLAAQIAGAAGPLGFDDTARVASLLAEIGDDMAPHAWSWDVVNVFSRTLSLVANPPEDLTDAHREILMRELDTVRASIRARLDQSTERPQG